MRLVIDNLTVSYDNREVLENVSFEVCGKDFIGIAGPNGGGKTTLVKAIVGLVPYEGKIEFEGNGNDSSRDKIGYLPQINSFDRVFPISVRDVVLSGLQSKKLSMRRYSKDEKQKAERLMCLTGVEHIARKPIGELSGGQIQRTLLCRALISEPELLILDEPTNFVDNKFESEFYALLQELNERMAIIMVSHNVTDITKYVQQIVYINKTAKIYSPSEFKALF